MKRRQQNQKISFHFLSGSPHTPRRKRIGKEIFGFVGRPEGARGAQSLHALRAYDLVQSHHALGAWIIRQNPADFVHTMFELRPKNTAKFYIQRNWKNLPRRKAPRHGIFPQFWRHFWNPKPKCGRQCGSSQSEALAKWNFTNQSFFFRFQRKGERIFLWLPKN